MIKCIWLLALAAHAASIISTSGSGAYLAGQGEVDWNFTIDGVSCSMQGATCYTSQGTSIDGVYFPPMGFFVGLNPEGGLQDFLMSGVTNGVVYYQEYQTFATIQAITAPYPGVTGTTFLFSPVAAANGELIPPLPEGQVNFQRPPSSAPEPSPIFTLGLALAGLIVARRAGRG